MRHLLLPLLLLACAPASSTDDTDEVPDAGRVVEDDAPAPDVYRPTPEQWAHLVCEAPSGDPDPWCIAAQSRDAGTDGAWCHLRDVREGDEGLTPWAECFAYVQAGMSAAQLREWASFGADCTHPPPRCGVGTSRVACRSLRVYAGRTVMAYVSRAIALRQCWPRTP